MEKIVYLDKQDDVPLTPEMDEEAKLDAAVKWINRKVANTVHFGLLQVGYFLLNGFFDGNIEHALSKSPKKTQSFRRLCRRPDLVISATHLVSAVKLVVQEKMLSGDRTFASLPISHKIALLPVANVEMKRLLTARALDEGLSVRALTKEVRAAHGKGLPQQAWSRRFRRALDTVRKEVEAPEAADLKALGSQEAQALKTSVEEAKHRLEGVLAQLPSRSRKLGRIVVVEAIEPPPRPEPEVQEPMTLEAGDPALGLG